MRYFEIYAWTDCPYCQQAKELLISKDHQFMFCCLDLSDALLAHIKTKWIWTTVPMILEKFTNSNEVNFVGGFSDLVEYLENK